MTTLKNLIAGLLISLMSAAPVAAWTPESEVLSGDQLNQVMTRYSDEWVMMRAERGDTRWGVYGDVTEAARGFVNANVSQFVPAAGGDRQTLDTEADFGPHEGIVYAIPLQHLPADSDIWAPLVAAGLVPDREIPESVPQVAPAVRVADLLALIETSQAEINEIKAWQDRAATAFNQLNAGMTQNRDRLTGLEQWRDATTGALLNQAGRIAQTDQRLTEGLAQVNDDLVRQSEATEENRAMIAGVQSGLEFQAGRITDTNERISALDADFTTQIGGVTAATVWLKYAIYGVALLMLILAAFVFMTKRKQGVLQAAQLGHGQHLVDHAERLEALEAGVAGLETGHATLSETVEDLSAATAADFDWHEANASPEALANLSLGEAGITAWRLTHRATGAQYVVRIGRDENTPAGQVQTDLLRKIGSTELVGAVAIKRLQTKIIEAIKSGRLQPQTANLQAVA